MTQDSVDECPFCGFSEPDVTVVDGVHVQAFISRSPLNRHHVLVVPREHYTHFSELPIPVLNEAFAVAQALSTALATGIHPDGITMMSDDDLRGEHFNLVPHWKLHLIPRYHHEAIRIEWGREPDPGREVRAGYAAEVRAALKGQPR